MVSLGYDDIGLSREFGFGSADEDWKTSGPSGEYCRVCRAEEDADRKQLANGNGKVKTHGTDFVFERMGATKGGDMDVVAVPFVFRLLLAELASMGIQLRVGVE